MDTRDVTLPEIGDDRLEEIETTLFARIAVERTDAAVAAAQTAAQDAERARARAVRRGRVWMGAAAAAAFVAVAAVIAPQLAGGAASTSSVVTADQPASAQPPSLEGDAVTLDGRSFGGADAGGSADVSGSSTDQSREVVATGSASVVADDLRAAIDRLTAGAESAGGYVESVSLGEGAGTAWITVRIPADTLTATIAGLSDLGEVTDTRIDRRDVTTETVDLRARVASLETSIARLQDLLAQSASTSDLIAAESALAERQGELDSLRQQLTWLDGQVQMSSLTVSVSEPAPPEALNPRGFGDGLAAGWNGLVATLGGLVVAVGFLIPWVAVLAVIGLLGWGVRGLVRRRGARSEHTEE